jgi:hypothetical protein
MKQLLSHINSQLRIGFRDPAYMFTSIVLPAGLYWFFAVPESGNAYTAKYMTGSFCAFSFFGVIFLQYSINTSQEKTVPMGSVFENSTDSLPTGHFLSSDHIDCSWFFGLWLDLWRVFNLYSHRPEHGSVF